MVAKAKPDGYTLLVAVESSQTRGLALYPALSYDQVKDFTYVRKVAKQFNIMVVNPSVPVSNVKEFIEYARKNPQPDQLRGHPRRFGEHRLYAFRSRQRRAE